MSGIKKLILKREREREREELKFCKVKAVCCFAVTWEQEFST